ncbi:tetratricopeptide repeat protein [candidate division WOR-3 bacterium]|nr:tetratricopeptide repeat protein [candidate division WOR-3 bacterium]
MNPFLPNDIDTSFALKKRKGALLFADLKGFTELSEKFAEHGVLGTGELTQIIDGCFDSLLTVVRKYDGDVIEFIGDALFIKFKTMKAAEKCAKEMSEKIRSFSDLKTSLGGFSLSMKIVYARGRWNELILGNPKKAVFFLTGKTLKRIALYEEKKSKEDIVEAPSAGTESRKKIESLPIDFNIKGTKSFLPNFSERLPKKGTFGEFRSVACVFIKIAGYDEENPDYENLNSAFVRIFKAIEKHGGSLNDLDNAREKGSRLLVLFGAPVAFGDDSERAVMFALETIAVLNGMRGLQASSSVGAGYVYAGIIGDKKRKKYSVIGDTVNSTSRILDTLYDGEIAVSDDVFRMTKNRINYEAMTDVRVKGKKGLLKRYRPLSFKRELTKTHPFVGREKELKKVTGCVIKSRTAIRIVGQAGIGKTRFIEETARIVAENGVTVYRARAEEHRPAFHLFSSLAKNICSIADDDSAKTKFSKLKKAFERSGKIPVTAIDDINMIAGMLFGMEVPDEKRLGLTPELKKENLIGAMVKLIESAGRRLCVILDDLHWSKPEDTEAIKVITRSLLLYSQFPVSIILSSRSEADLSLDEKRTKSLKIDLKPFDKKPFDKFIAQVLGRKKLEDQVLKTVVERSGGNPFYAEQILSYLRDKNLIIEKSDKWLAVPSYREDALPENLFSIVTARIDKLGERIRESLRIASAIGMEFKVGIIDEVMRGKTVNELKSAAETGLVNLADREELEYIFSHALFKDVIYQSILSEKRKTIHLAVAKALEKSGATNSKERLSSLAHHYDIAQKWNKAFKYRLEAGRKYKSEYLNEEAIFNLERAIQIAYESPVPIRQKLQAMEDLIETYFNTGKVGKSLTWAEELDRRSEGDPVIKSKALRYMSLCLSGEKNFREALSSLEKAYRSLRSSSYSCTEEKIMNALARANIYRNVFDLERSLAEAQKAEMMYGKLSKKRKDPKVEVRICMEIGSSHYSKFDYDLAVKKFREASDIAEKINDKHRQASAISNSGVIYHYQGKFDKALSCYKKTESITGEIGDRRGQCLSKLNIGCAYNDMKKIEEALVKFKEALRIALEIDFVKMIMFLYINIGNSYNNMRRHKEAAQYTEKAKPYAEELRDYSALARINENLGNIFSRQENLDMSEKCFTESMKYLDLCKDLKWKVYVSEKISKIQIEKMEYIKALETLRKTLRVSRKIDSREGVFESMSYAREIFRETGKNKLAEIYSKKTDENQAESIDKEVIAIHLLKKADFLICTAGAGRLDEIETVMDEVKRLNDKIKAEKVEVEYYYLLGKFQRVMKNYDWSLKTLKKTKKLSSSIKWKSYIARVYLEMSLLLKDKGDQLSDKYLEKAEKEFIKMNNHKRAEWAKRVYSNHLKPDSNPKLIEPSIRSISPKKTL